MFSLPIFIPNVPRKETGKRWKILDKSYANPKISNQSSKHAIVGQDVVSKKRSVSVYVQ